MAYVGRFAPSPTGPLHAGSLVAALASWLDARAHRGRWLVRIEDVDSDRCKPEWTATILSQLSALGLESDLPPAIQSARSARYRAVLDRLIEAGLAYPCSCSRSEIDAALSAAGTPPRRDAERVYPGTCRDGLRGRAARAWRMRVGAEATIQWEDRRLGPLRQNLGLEVGDFVLKRADGDWAYQLAVVVDDAEQGITDVVRGEDLASNTPRQIHLQQALGLPRPRYLHSPLVVDGQGRKLSKQTAAKAIDVDRPLLSLRAAGTCLGLPDLPAAGVGEWLASAVAAWRGTWIGAR